MKLRKGCDNRGQVTIFIIIAIVIVGGVFLVYTFFPQIKSAFTGTEQNPTSYIQTCVEEELQNAVDLVSLQGGSLDPAGYLLHDDSKVEYLCYTEEFYKTCTVQRVLLKNHIEEELESAIKETVESCFNSLKESYENRGYNVDLKRGAQDVELLPKRVVATFNYSVSLTKEDTANYDSFVVVLNNNLYELISIANSIIKSENLYGDSVETYYMYYYHDLKVDKINRGDGRKIYIITDLNNENKFQFATRGQIWPAGYPDLTQ